MSKLNQMKQFKFLCCIALFLLSASAIAADSVATRFGTFSVNDENVLLYKGKPTNPKVEGNNGLSIEKALAIGDSDILLVESLGGTACPMQLRFVKISQSGVTLSKEFGTCTDNYQLKQSASRLVITMAGYVGAFELPKAQRDAAKRKVVFVYENGALTENGKQVN